MFILLGGVGAGERGAGQAIFDEMTTPFFSSWNLTRGVHRERGRKRGEREGGREKQSVPPWNKIVVIVAVQ